MKTLTTISELRAEIAQHRLQGQSIGLVPTMGYLHSGHASLIERAAAECDLVITTVFVNPLQFAATEDLSSYPRDAPGDSRTAAAAGADLLFLPGLQEMYPLGREGVLTSVSVNELSAVMEGESRPTHFAGMCTVVAKLFNIAGPCTAYFGKKDFQQLAIVQAMVRDLSFDVELVGCEICREPDGLAMSSRNVYLSTEQRAAAPVLAQALVAAARSLSRGETSVDRLRATMMDVISTQAIGQVEYLEVVDPITLRPLTQADARSRFFGAVRFGSVRLIDNLDLSELDLDSNAAISQ
ncbi:pantoate--beta-alanine ligase [Actinobacteria bacterium IMCC26207]|nr:pantoate--beta-alanine ligase [Actinobacteria bacterium IMCC26207]